MVFLLSARLFVLLLLSKESEWASGARSIFTLSLSSWCRPENDEFLTQASKFLQFQLTFILFFRERKRAWVNFLPFSLFFLFQKNSIQMMRFVGKKWWRSFFFFLKILHHSSFLPKFMPKYVQLQPAVQQSQMCVSCDPYFILIWRRNH